MTTANARADFGVRVTDNGTERNYHAYCECGWEWHGKPLGQRVNTLRGAREVFATHVHVPRGTSFVPCVNTAHDHTTTTLPDGSISARPVPQTCPDCGLPTHYDNGVEDYLHDNTAAACWLHKTPTMDYVGAEDTVPTECQWTACIDCGDTADDLRTCEVCGLIGCTCLVRTQSYDCGKGPDGMTLCDGCAPTHAGCPACDPDFGRD